PAPAVSMTRPPKHVAKQALVKLQGSIEPHTQSISVLVEKKNRSTWQRFYGRTVAVRADGTFTKKVRFRYEGLYRASFVFGGDGSYAPSRSKVYHVRVPRSGGSGGGGTSGAPPYEPPASTR
ncbi:MAG TPA: hypothetical protein VF517_12075, partial [Thermoleophilaceae bacterium]